MKHLLITGATGNLGKELLKIFDFKKYDKIYLVVSREKLKSDSFQSDKFKIFSDFDLKSEESVSEIFSNISIQKEDLLFVIHLVGGYAGGKHLWEFSKDDLQLMLDKNLITSFLISKYSLIKAREGKGGSILFISARISLDYEPKRSVYAVSKNALNFLVKIIEKEGRELNFTANALAPYLILTEENKKWLKESNLNKYSSPEEMYKIIDSIFESYLKFNGNIFLMND
jgi:3-oxoacyl-[acyl-carrier protein] reductase